MSLRRRVVPLIGLVLVVLMLIAPGAVAQTEPEPDNSVDIVQVDSTSYPDVTFTLSVPGEADIDDDRLSVLENGVPVSVAVEPSGIAGLKVVLVLDTSTSMSGEALAAMQQAASAFVQSLPEGARVAVVNFSTTANLAQQFTADRVAAVNAIRALEADGGTSLYDGLAAALTTLGPTAGTDRVIVTLTDGNDTDSTTTLEDIAERIAAADVQFAGIALTTENARIDAVHALASQAGGRSFEVSDPSLLIGVYGLLAAGLENRYEVSYTSSSKVTDNQLEIQLDGRRLVDREVVYLGLEEVIDLSVPPSDPVRLGTGGVLAQPWIPWIGALFIVAGVVGCVLLVQSDSERRALRSVTSGLDSGLATSLPGDFSFDERIADAERSVNAGEVLSGVAENLTGVAAKILDRRGKSAAIDETIERAGISMRAGELGAFVLTASLTGLALGFTFGGPIAGLLLLVLPGALTGPVLSFLASRRRKKFGDQLGDTLILISGALKSGYGLAQSLDSVAAEAESPTKEEFSRALLETRLGLTLEQALDGVNDRMRSEDFGWVVNAVKINATVGGDLSTILDQVGETIRARTKMKRQIQALAAEGKISALVLFSLPPILVGFIASANPTYISPLFSSTTGYAILALAGLLMAVGGLWLRKLVNPEV